MQEGKIGTGRNMRDQFERLTSQATTVGAARTLTFGYDLYGNLTTKTSSQAGDLNATAYGYGAGGKPHRLAAATIGGIANTLSYDANGSITTYDAASGNDTFLSYDGQNHVTTITVGASAGTPTPSARDAFWYDPDGARFLGRETWLEAGGRREPIT
jgi:YD repeat-containing protein